MYWALQTLKFSLNPECSPTSLLDEVPGHWVKGKASVIWLGETESFPVVQGRGNAYCLSRLQRHCQPPLQGIGAHILRGHPAYSPKGHVF